VFEGKQQCSVASREAPTRLVIPAQAGLRRQDAEANIRAANGSQGTRQEPHVIQFFSLLVIPAQAGIQFLLWIVLLLVIPAKAGIQLSSSLVIPA